MERGWVRTRSGVRKLAQGWKRLSYTWGRPIEITAKRKTSVPTTVPHSPWAIPQTLIIAQIVATTIIFHVTTIRYWRRLFRRFIMPLKSIHPGLIIKRKRMIFNMMDLSLKRKSKSGRHTFCASTIRNNASKASCCSSRRPSFYIIWLGKWK